MSALQSRRGPGASTASRHGSSVGGCAPAEVQRALGVVEVLQVPAAARPRLAHPGGRARHVTGARGPRRVAAPDVAVTVGMRPVRVALGLEPRMLERDEVEQHPDAAVAGLPDELDEVVVGAVPRRDA